MFISKLKLHNFKSFKNAQLVFREGFNSIVGPNGSGKSNIVDATLFAFGESSMKQLRAKKASDLTFKNSKVSSVTLYFENPSHVIERTIQRKGNQNYYLDGKRVKKYVIDDFLAAHRLSTNNVIMQGAVQKIVEMSPKERRALVDEVASVAEYEQKKKEAYEKLKEVEDKLNSASAILSERKGYLEELEREKENAESYLKLQEQLKKVKGSLIYGDLKNTEDKLKSAEKKMEGFSESSSKLKEEISKLEENIKQKQKQKDEINKIISEKGQNREIELQKEIDTLSSKMSEGQTMIKHDKEEIEEAETKQREEGIELKNIEEESRALEKQKKEKEEELHSVQEILKNKRNELKEITEASEKFSSKYFESKKRIEVLNEEMIKTKEALAEIQGEISKLDEVKRVKRDEIERLRIGRVEDYSIQKKAIENKMKDLKGNYEKLERGIEEDNKKIEEINGRIGILEDLILNVREEIMNLNARVKAYGEKGSEKINLYKQIGQLKGINGPLYNLCSYSQKYELAVEAALGKRLDYFIAERFDDGIRAVEFLKKKGGQASFIPLDKLYYINARDKKLLREKGAIDYVVDILKFDKKFSKAFEYACANTLIVENINEAKKFANKVRIVTLEGEIVEKSGVISGGRKTVIFDPLRAEKKMEELKAKIEKYKEEKQKLIIEVAELNKGIREKRKEKAKIEIESKSKELELEHLNKKELEDEEKKYNLKQAIGKAMEEVKELEENIQKMDEKRNELVRRISKINVELVDARQYVDVEKEKTLGMQIKEKEKNLSELKIKIVELESEIKSLGNSYEMRIKQIKNLKKNLEESMKKIEAKSKEIKEHKERIKELSKELGEKKKEQENISSRLLSLFKQREEIDAQITKIGNEKGKKEFEKEKIERELHKLETEKASLESSLAIFKAEFEEFESIEIINEKKEKLFVERKELEGKIADLGEVNLRSIEAFKEKKKQYEAQIEQVQQLEREKEAVIGLINEIETKKTNTFMKTFDVLNLNFKKLFKHIFTGEGSLVLENPEQPFEGGLTMEIKLERKPIKYLELMSGGEKSLVALLFILAIQMYNPSSIYILDEADAALDPENSRKLALLLKKLASNKSQIIVISHNLDVYRKADTLIGVAMTKAGSQLVHVKLEQQGK